MSLPRRPPPRLKVENFGPLKHADITFGDLTVFVGPQATGKSILLQLLKLLEDTPYIRKEFNRAGVDWSGKFTDFLDVYFGEGMNSVWSSYTSIEEDGVKIKLPDRVEEKRPNRQESMFFIPAHGPGKKLDKFARLFYWVPSGATSFTQGSAQVRKLADKGIIYSGSKFRIPLNHKKSKPQTM